MSKLSRVFIKGLSMSNALKEKWIEILISTILGISILAGGWVYASSIENGKDIVALEESKVSNKEAREMELRLSSLDPEVIRFMSDMRGAMRDLKSDMKDDIRELNRVVQKHIDAE